MPKMRELTVREIEARLLTNQTSSVLLDVREPWEYQICHLPNTRLIPMRTIPSVMHELGLTQEIIVICHHGVRSRIVGNFLEQHGFKHVINMQGGMAAWARDVDHAMATY